MFYLFYYLSWALFSSLISVYLIAQGFSASQASLIVSVSFLCSMLFQPVIGSVADRFGMKSSTALLMGLAAAGGIIFLLSKSFWMIMASYSFVMTLLNGTNPIMEKICTASPFSYGKIRIWGTIGYAAGTQLAGWLHDHVFPSSIFIAFLITAVLCLIGALFTEPKEATKAGTDHSEDQNGGLAALLKSRKFLIYLLMSGLFYGVTAASNTFIPAFLTSSGLETSAAGTLLSLAVLAELPLILFSGRFMDKMTSKSLTFISFGMIILLISVCASESPSWISLPVILLTKHPGSMLFIMLNLKIVTSLVDQTQVITALALVSTVKSLVSMLFNSMTGVMIDAAGYQIAFMILLIFMVAAFFIALLFRMPKGTDVKLFS